MLNSKNEMLEEMMAYASKAKELHIKRDFSTARQFYTHAIKIGFAIVDSTTSTREKESICSILQKLYECRMKCSGPNFDDVVGLFDFKKLFNEGIFSVIRNKEIADTYQVKANCCILLQGPPGTGKSFGIKAAVNEFPEAYLIETKCSEIIDAHIGTTGKNIDELFKKAKDYLAKEENSNNYVIIFIDEIDGIARSRTLDDKAAKEAMSSLLVNLTKVDEDNDNIIFICATNTPDQLDSAFVSRFGNNIIEIPLPDDLARIEILKKNLPFTSKEINWNKVAEETKTLNGRDLKFIAKDANRVAFNKAVSGNKGPVDESILLDMIEVAKERRSKRTSYI